MNIGICLRTLPIWVGEFVRACTDLNLSYKLIEIDREDWRTQLEQVDLFLWRIHLGDLGGLFQARMKMPIIEAMGIYCFPAATVVQLYDNKILQTYLFHEKQIPTPATFVSFDETEARNFVLAAVYPLVAKTYHGASSTGVRLLRSPEAGCDFVRRAFRTRPLPSLASRVVRKIGNWLHRPNLSNYGLVIRDLNYVYFQDYVKSDGDLRITTFGNDVISAFKRLNRPNDFRASGSGRWERLTPETLPADAGNLALKISHEQGFPVMTYDFLYDGNQWLITEMSYGFLLNRIYTDTLFQREGEKFKRIDPISLGQLHLMACREKMENR